MSKQVKATAKKPEAKKTDIISKTRKQHLSKYRSSPIDHILLLQRTIGNRAVQRLFQSGAIQAKLKIGQPGDKYEQEANRVANQVVRIKKSEKGEKSKPLDIKLQAKSKSGKAIETSSGIEREIKQKQGAGKQLDTNVREQMESSFNTDFNNVRIHSDTQSDSLNRLLNAKAFTHGSDIYFKSSSIDFSSGEGKKLLAHELAHVVQQRQWFQPRIQRFAGCSQLLANPVGPISLLGGVAIHRLIEQHFLSSVPGALTVGIPGASAGPLRTQGLCGQDTKEIRSQIVGGRAGMGFPDLARITPGGVLQIAEIKPAVHVCLIDGEEQALRYIDQGNNRFDPEMAAWRSSLGISVVSPMPPSTYIPPPFVVPPVTILTAWCNPGLMAYSVVPLPVPIGERERMPQEEPRRIGYELEPEPGLRPVPVTELSAYELILQWARQVIESGADATQAADEFLRQHPEIAWTILILGVVGIIALAADDVTLAGIADDVLIPVIAALMRVAWRFA